MKEKQYDFSKIRAIIGLGNPGAKYFRTRHNIGFRMVDLIADKYAASWNESDIMEHTVVLYSPAGSEEVAGLPQKSVYLIKPQTFMNSSGRVVPFLLKKGIKAEEILVVHDELEKPFGKMAIRFGGSARGHNGLRSIEGTIGKEYWRFRFGIGRPERKEQVGNYVLTPFLPDEEKEVDLLLEKGFSMIIGGN